MRNLALDISFLIVWAELGVLNGAEVVNSLLKTLLQALIEALEEGGTSRQHNILVKFDTVLDWARVDSLVNHVL